MGEEFCNFSCEDTNSSHKDSTFMTQLPSYPKKHRIGDYFKKKQFKNYNSLRIKPAPKGFIIECLFYNVRHILG